MKRAEKQKTTSNLVRTLQSSINISLYVSLDGRAEFKLCDIQRSRPNNKITMNANLIYTNPNCSLQTPSSLNKSTKQHIFLHQL